MTTKNKNTDITKHEPFVAKIHDVNIDTEYIDWLSELKNRYRKTQIKAAIKVNSEKLLWNWQLGRDLVMLKAESRWGEGIVEQLSLDLQNAFPNDKGFGSRNLWYMKKWYLFFSQGHSFEKLHQLGAELQVADNQTKTKLHQLGAEITDISTDGVVFPDFFAFVPWRHHVDIITQCKDIDEAIFYITRTIANGWSRSALNNCIKADYYHTHSGAVSNFTEYLPDAQAELAQEITKENYDFGFIKLPERFDEDQLEEALAKQMTRFLLELGTGFAFVGRQKEIIVAGKGRRMDLLFYHIKLRAYIVCELKAKPFQPEYVGKLNFYVSAVDELIKSEQDNPTIGLLICSNLDETEVKWAFRGVNTPLGVATYSNVQIAEIQKELPTVEELMKRVKLLEKELKKKQ